MGPNEVLFPAWHDLDQCCNVWILLTKKLFSCWSKCHQQQIWHHHHHDTGPQPSIFFMLENRWESDGIKSREEINWSTSSKPQSCTAAMETKDMCAGTLSCWIKTLCISFPRHFVLITFHNCLKKLVQYPPLIMCPFWRWFNKHNAFYISEKAEAIFHLHVRRDFAMAWIAPLSLTQWWTEN